ncbi:MAG: ORF6N domain-containing protein [Bacteroidetes bacterium]|nr:ORF6N domain-containing protein [Bacteroidota bacterium]MCL6101779.1 ORF6N domain-containing protein [Bacteroidota bacterium]
MKAPKDQIANSLIKPEYETLIFHYRGFKVMIDSDLAMLYDVPTKRLKEQVKRNVERFPEDFMFELTNTERDELVANCDRLATLKHSSINPLAFTEQGVAMLSSVLHSDKAIKINIEIMRAFARYRAFLSENQELKKEILKLDAKLNQAFKFLLDKLDSLHQKATEPRKLIGYKTAQNG